MKSLAYLLIDVVKYGFKGDIKYKAWLGFLGIFSDFFGSMETINNYPRE